MFLKNFKAKTPSLRFKKNIYKLSPFFKKNNKLTITFNNKSGRNNSGSIVVRHRGGYIFNNKNIINYNRIQLTNLSIITSISYFDKNSCFLGLIKYSTGSISYIKLANGNFIGDYIKSYDKPINFSFNTKNLLGCFIILKLAPKYCVFSNIIQNNISKYAKSAGTYLNIVKKIKELNIFILKLPTGEKKYFSGLTTAIIGRNSNHLNKFTCIGKAGINRLKGFRPTVRGVAMNPVDHPHGGRTKTNQPEMSPWGWIAKKTK
uniref:Ribosomal protein L2 n=1 Tax=Tetrahymena paravorax TaxID=5905 RepID=Q09F75_TETPR|nr:ribosomal protein L2 [Tetrahymena paravorax]ABI51676.1 ribosomal protein L2 [Tetrahymena paravorax]